ncbi:hypothetical protein ACFY1P_19960 [Streptomyces sp. NPDC001407]|uniref:hypothetical protein n=1 Tax=Streptomyces sp. NPDC001407 TaxID=3364573 RepID=UPI0036832844
MTWHRNDDGVYTRHAQPPGHPLRGALDLGLTAEEVTRYDAHHEAGHAVLGLLKGMPVRRATLEPNDLHSAHVEFGPWSGPWWSYAIMMAAGDRAGDRWLREADLWTAQRAWIAERGCDSDRRKVAETVPEPSVVIFGALPAGAQPQQGVAHYQALQDEADFWLDMYWPRVQRLAGAMIEHCELSAHRISELTGIPLTQTAASVSTEGEA